MNESKTTPRWESVQSLGPIKRPFGIARILHEEAVFRQRCLFVLAIFVVLILWRYL